VLILANVTHEDSGWYTCKVENEQGSATASGYIAVEENDDDASANGVEESGGTVVFLAIGMAALFVICILILLFFVLKWKQEKTKKVLATEAFTAVYQWTKVVLVEKQLRQDCATDCGETPIRMPRITIEKRK
jgi:hypothetical protein